MKNPAGVGGITATDTQFYSTPLYGRQYFIIFLYSIIKLYSYIQFQIMGQSVKSPVLIESKTFGPANNCYIWKNFPNWDKLFNHGKISTIKKENYCGRMWWYCRLSWMGSGMGKNIIRPPVYCHRCIDRDYRLCYFMDRHA